MSKFSDENDTLLGALGVEVEAKKEERWSAKEEQIIAGFEEIQRFFEFKGRTYMHGEDRVSF